MFIPVFFLSSSSAVIKTNYFRNDYDVCKSILAVPSSLWLGMTSALTAAVLRSGGRGRGTMAPSHRSGPHCPPPDEIFVERNRTSGMKI